MSDQPKYVVLVRYRAIEDDEQLIRGRIWIEAGPIEAANGDAAIERLRATVAELKEDKGAQFVAVAASRFKRRRMRRQLVQRFALDDAEVPDDPVPGEDPQQERLS